MLDPADFSPVVFRPVHDVLTGIRFESLDAAVAYGCGLEVSAFLHVCGYGDEDAGVAKVFELVPDIETVVLRHDETIMLFSWDGEAVRFFQSDNDDKLREFERHARNSGHALIGVMPGLLREWLKVRMGYREN